jgi:hypothetical protein
VLINFDYHYHLSLTLIQSHKDIPINVEKIQKNRIENIIGRDPIFQNIKLLEIHFVYLKQSTSEKYQESYEEKFSVSSCNSNQDVLKPDQSSINRLSKTFLNLALQ